MTLTEFFCIYKSKVKQKVHLGKEKSSRIQSKENLTCLWNGEIRSFSGFSVRISLSHTHSGTDGMEATRLGSGQHRSRFGANPYFWVRNRIRRTREKDGGTILPVNVQCTLYEIENYYYYCTHYAKNNGTRPTTDSGDKNDMIYIY